MRESPMAPWWRSMPVNFCANRRLTYVCRVGEGELAIRAPPMLRLIGKWIAHRLNTLLSVWSITITKSLGEQRLGSSWVKHRGIVARTNGATYTPTRDSHGAWRKAKWLVWKPHSCNLHFTSIKTNAGWTFLESPRSISIADKLPMRAPPMRPWSHSVPVLSSSNRYLTYLYIIRDGRTSGSGAAQARDHRRKDIPENGHSCFSLLCNKKKSARAVVTVHDSLIRWFACLSHQQCMQTRMEIHDASCTRKALDASHAAGSCRRLMYA